MAALSGSFSVLRLAGMLAALILTLAACSNEIRVEPPPISGNSDTASTDDSPDTPEPVIETDDEEYVMADPLPRPTPPPRTTSNRPERYPSGGETAEMIIRACDPADLENDLDWPPPAPSTQVVIPRSLLLAGLGATPTLNEVGERVDYTLDAAGYNEKAYFSIGCDGWAIVTRLERIDAEGAPVEGGRRFDPPEAGEPWSLSGYISRLFYAPPGYYRQIIFVATPREIDPDEMPTLEGREQIEAIAAEGATEMVELDDTEGWTQGHALTALIYEFRSEGQENVEVRRPSPIPGGTHLAKAGIYPDLGRD